MSERITEAAALHPDRKTRSPRFFGRVAGAIAGVLLSLVGVITAAPAAFATRPVDPGNGYAGSVAPITATHSGGMPGWEIALIVAGAVLVAVLVTIVAVRARSRGGLRPATN